MEIVAVPAFTDNYIWLVHDEASGETAVVDPGDAAPGAGRGRAARMDDHARSGTPTGTRDHTGGNLAIKEATGCTVSGPGGGEYPGARRRACPKATNCASASTSAA